MILLARIFIYGLIIVFSSTYVLAGCDWSFDSYSDIGYVKICPSNSFLINCISTVASKFTSSSCIYNGDMVPIYSDYLNIAINLENPDENPFLEDAYFFTKLTIQDGYLVTIPLEVYNMSRLTDFKMSDNKLRKINFYDFLSLRNLKRINLAHNKIIVIETKETLSNHSVVQDIDISYNFIETVPDHFIKRFSGLEHLNMSHNSISSISRHAFEGTIELKTLDLSHNKLQEVENIFNQLPRLIDSNYATPTNLQKLSKLVLDDNFISNINFTEFFETGIPELSIGGNLVTCNELARIKFSHMAEKFDSTVTAIVLNFDNDNINGIHCERKAKCEITHALNVSDDPNSNSSILVSLLKNAVENNSKSVETVIDIVNRNEKKLEQLIQSTNNFLLNISDQLADIKNSIHGKPNVAKLLIPDIIQQRYLDFVKEGDNI